MKDPAGPKRLRQTDGPEDDPGLNIEILRRRRDILLTITAMLLILGVTSFAAYKFLRGPAANSTDIASAALQAVRASMAGYSVQAGLPEEVSLKAITSGQYEATGRVVAVDQEGQSGYYLFKCFVERPPEGSWKVSKVELTALY